MANKFILRTKHCSQVCHVRTLKWILHSRGAMKHIKKSRIRLLAKQDSWCLHITSIAWITLIFKYLFLLLIFYFIQAISQCTGPTTFGCVYGRQKCVSCGACFSYLEWKERKKEILHGCHLQIFEIVASVWLHSIILVRQWSIIITPCLHFALFAGWLKMYVIFNMKTSIMTSNYNW